MFNEGFIAQRNLAEMCTLFTSKCRKIFNKFIYINGRLSRDSKLMQRIALKKIEILYRLRNKLVIRHIDVLTGVIIMFRVDL